MAAQGDHDPLTPEQREQLQASRRKVLLIGLAFGVLLMVLGFFAGQNLGDSKNAGAIVTGSEAPAILAALPAPDAQSGCTVLNSVCAVPAITL